MPKEKLSLSGMLLGDEPGLITRVLHSLAGEDEGSWGEKCITTLLKNRIENATVFQNIYVPTDNGTTELDVVMVNQTGIYVFESKAYGGKIYGHPDHMKWTQYLGGEKYTFYNPIKQNKNHCSHLAQALQIPSASIVSFIVFENRTDLSKVTQLSGSCFTVCNRNKLTQALKSTISTRNITFSAEELTVICTKLEQWSQSNATTDIAKEHIQQVKNRMFGDTCPVCGKELVERKGKYGTFIGCSGYPHCKYTREQKQT